jgi:D-alanyl-lipoteichoic acid acyltransferase DltB (MBOAT superfamily)
MSVAKAFANGGNVAVEPGKISAGNFLIVLAQLGLLALVLRQFQIENAAFLRVAMLAFGGFAVHALLPLRFRLPFFLLLSFVGIAVALGVGNGAWLVGIGLILIGLCHLPVSFAWRGTLLLGACALLVALRASWLPALWSEAIWPILGSMFMFRLIVYFYDLRHDKAPVSVMRTLSYFFMLPNACFPLFPVVDYKAFRRNYYDDDAYRIYQVGVDWMVRGVIHLVLYRFVYLYLTLAPAEVTDAGELVRYLVSNFLLYLRISGQFHLVIGMLYLFGFRLPETHHLYLLASSFTDFWRRINIYWKDFMLKVFYYPAYFKLRGLGNTRAMVLSTLFVFVMTWFLHAYQWFWLRGTILFVWQDVLFWAILGGLVVINSLWEAKHGRDRSLGKTSRSWRSLVILTLKTFATFCFICVLWSFWTSESISAWLSLWTAVGKGFTVGTALVLALLMAVLVLAFTLRDSNEGAAASKRAPAKAARLRPVAVTMVSLLMLTGLGIEAVYSRLGTTVATAANTLRSGRLNRLDNAMLERGYYEQLLHVDRFNSQLWEVYTKKPANWLDVEGSGLKRFTGDFAQSELIPSLAISTQFGKISVNRWGMRDQDYEAQPAFGVYRMALLGPSTVMGWGVADGETFEALLENRLNRDRPQAPFSKYEILNFAVPGYQPPQELVAFEKATAFGPHAIIYVATGREITQAARYLVQVVQKRIDIPYDYLRTVVQKAGLEPGMDETVALKRLEAQRAEILTWVYRRIVDESRARGIVPVFVFLPQVYEGAWQEETPETLRIAEAAGFVVIDLANIYKNEDIRALRVADWDNHPNARGHQLIAARLYDALRERQDVVFKGAAPPAPGARATNFEKRETPP